MIEIQCERCWKTIIKKNNRVLCIACSNARDREISKKYRESHREEIRERNKARAREKYNKLKWEW